MKKFIFLFLLTMGCTGLSAQVKVIAHRGYWKAPGSAQNSIASILKADEIGAYGSEFDVILSKEGKLYVNHDRVFQGVDVYEESYKVVRKVKLNNGERIPLLPKYLKTAKNDADIRLILEMKSLPSQKEEDLAVDKIVEQVKRYDLLNRTDFIAFSLYACKAFRKMLPEANVFYLRGDVDPKGIKELGLTGIDYDKKVFKKHPEWVKEAHDLGLKVNVWTVNKEEDMKYLIGLGVDYITTDYPEVLQKIISDCEGKDQ